VFAFCREYLRKRHFRKALTATREWKRAFEGCSKELPELDEISELMEQPLPLSKFIWKIFTPEVSQEQAELVLRQKISATQVRLQMFPAMIAKMANSRREHTAGMPLQWRIFARRKGFVLNNIPSYLSWFGFVYKSYLRAIKSTLRLFLNSRNMPYPPQNGYAVLHNMNNATGITRDEKGRDLHTLASWYVNGSYRIESEKQIWSEVGGNEFKNENGDNWSVPVPFPVLISFGSRVKFLSNMLLLLMLAGLFLCIGKWQAALLVEEAVYMKYIKQLTKKHLASTYVFNFANIDTRPLWTHLVETMGSRVIMVFYALNCAPFRWKDGTKTAHRPRYHLTNWSHYIVWDDEHVEYVRGLAGDCVKIDKVGTIPFADSVEIIPNLPDNAIAVFDISVNRNSFLAQLGIIDPYYTPDTLSQFLHKVRDAIVETGHVMVLKRKRDVGRNTEFKYGKALNELLQKEGVHILDPSINAERLIAEARGVVSIPYTSTSVAARAMGVPSVYFDPTKRLEKLGPELHGVELKQDISELKSWLKEISENH